MNDQFSAWIDSYAYQLLARRDYAVKELREKIIRAAEKKFEALDEAHEDEVRQLIETLEQRGHLDEDRFIRAWIANRIAYKPRSRYMLLQELRLHGADLDLAERILKEEVPPAVEKKMAASLAGKKGRTQKDPQKIIAYLSSKGFSYETIRSVLGNQDSEKARQKSPLVPLS